MAEATEEEVAGLKLAASDSSPQRRILYARKDAVSAQRHVGRRALNVPKWFDLPVLLTETHPVAARIQRKIASKTTGNMLLKRTEAGAFSETPKVSRLGPRVEEEEHKARKMGATVLKSTMRRRQNTRVRKLDGLAQTDRKSRLRDKLWKELSHFGLWPMAGYGMIDDRSLESTVDAIWTQWHDNNTLLTAESNLNKEISAGLGYGVGDGVLSDGEVETSGVFLTGVPSVSSFTTGTPEYGPDLLPGMKFVDSGATIETPEDDDMNEDEGESPSLSFGISRRLPAKVQTPGLKRRKRLTDLHQFVGIQLQKRLFKSWDTIEIAFSGSGDMTIPQIVKFLQLSDVQLGDKDAGTVQRILEDRLAIMQTAQHTGGEIANSNQKRTQARAVLSYEGFRDIFHPVKPEEASKWKREFDREKFRQKQEKDVYSKELAALEEKVRQRLANSAKHMIDILNQFKCDPDAIPWESDQQRVQLRSQFLNVIFHNPQRRRLLQLDNRLSHSDIPDNSAAATPTANSNPNKFSVKLILSTLLQKYSRNGHFESIEVPVAAYLYHDYAVDVMKQSVKRYWRRFEIDQWPERQMIFRFRKKKQIFYEWRNFAERAGLLRKHVLRKFVAWKYMTRKLHEHYAFYRICFWPFFVWKRHLQQMIIARGKTEFLINVLNTYIQLRNFRALKQRYRVKQWNQRHVARIRKKKAREMCALCWKTWKDRYQQSHLIRQIWRQHGHLLQQLHKYYMVRVTFYVLRYYSILKRDMKRRKYKSLLALFSMGARAKSLSQHQRQQHDKTRGVDAHNRSGQHRGSVYTAENDPKYAVSSRHSLPFSTFETQQVSKLSRPDVRSGSVQDSGLLARENFPHSNLAVVHDVRNGDPESSDEIATASLTRIMETELGNKIKRKSRLYDLCLKLYLKYRERDRINMIGNVIAYRRFGRLFINYSREMIRHNKMNRFATDLGAFRVMSSRFRQWMIGTVYKLPPVPHNDDIQPVSKDDETQEAGDKVVLHWQQDRDWRLQAIANNPIRTETLRKDLLDITEKDSMRMYTIKGRELLLNKKQLNEDVFLRKETGATLKMKAAQMQQVQQIMRRRAHRLHDAMDNVYDVLLQQQARQQLKSSFRSLRIAVMMKYASLLCHRAQIRNWIRLCHRFMYWEKHMNTFYKLKLKYRAFRGLLKYAVWKWKFQSPGLSQKLQRSRQLMCKYERYMADRSMFDGTPESLHLASTKFSPANSFHGIFLRWVQFTQFSKARQTIVKLVQGKQQIWSMHTVFQALKNRVKVKYTYEQRCARLPYLWRQSMVDLDSYYCRIIAQEKKLPTTSLREQLNHSRKLMQNTAMSSPTLKKLFHDHEKEVRLRLQLEKRLMLVAYNDRAVHNYAERSSSLYGTTSGCPFMRDKVPPFGRISEITVICGKKVDGIAVIVKANGHASFQGTLHGNAFGTREVFSLGKGEKLITVEGFASKSIYGLRFGTSTGRYSRWFGHCEKGVKFEVHSDYLTNREEIVGFFGHADSASINSMGVVMRRTTLKNPFEGLWMQRDHYGQQNASPPRGVGEELPQCDRQFPYFLQVRVCEVLLVMERAHLFALRSYRMEETVHPALGNMRIIMGLARWMLNALSHGLVHRTEREEEGREILQSGQERYAIGEKLLEEGVTAMQIVDSFRDSAGSLDAATLGIKKILELRELMNCAQQQMKQGQQLMHEGQSQIARSQRILPYLPATKRMISAIRKMYKVVQTKDEIDQMTPEVRSSLLLKTNGGSTADSLLVMQS